MADQWFAEIQHENKIVADWLLWYPDRKKKYEEKRDAVLHASPLGPSGMHEIVCVDSGRFADTTGEKAVKLAELDPATAKWLALVEEVERRLPLKMQIFLQLRQKLRHYRGRQGWTVPMQHRYAEEMARRTGKEEEFWIEDRTTFWRWWTRIVDYTARLSGLNLSLSLE